MADNLAQPEGCAWIPEPLARDAEAYGCEPARMAPVLLRRVADTSPEVGADYAGGSPFASTAYHVPPNSTTSLQSTWPLGSST
jgi:hypothetical protein